MPLIKEYKGKYPDIPEDVFIAENAVLIGDIVIGTGSSVWYGVVIRGDVNFIRIGSGTNIQDGSILHVEKDIYPLLIGDNVTVGHSAVVHGCTLKSNVLVGIGANILNGAEVGEYSLIAAGALVREGEKIPPGVLVTGVPGKIKRDLTGDERSMIDEIAQRYTGYAGEYQKK
ncbi:MAG: gamma carbonic anhydrase family protein [bacterium]|nr:gamma carbonic anhydrase family protein [bacterium]